MRKPRDFDGELKALQDKARDLKSRKVLGLGELVIAAGADSLSADCESARGPDADRHVKLLIQFAVEGSLSGAYSQRNTPRQARRRSSDAYGR